MKWTAFASAAAVLFGLVTAAQAAEFKTGSIVVENPWARASVGNSGVAGAFLVIHNDGAAADKLTSVTVNEARNVMMHNTVQDGEVMKMVMVDGIDVPAHGEATLKPGGYHIMLMGLKNPLKDGDTFPMILHFQNAGNLTVTVMVQKPSTMEPMTNMDMIHSR